VSLIARLLIRLFGTLFSVSGFKTFVAWRYLLVREPKVARWALWALLFGGAMLVALRLGFDAALPSGRTAAPDALFTVLAIAELGVFVATLLRYLVSDRDLDRRAVWALLAGGLVLLTLRLGLDATLSVDVLFAMVAGAGLAVLVVKVLRHSIPSLILFILGLLVLGGGQGLDYALRHKLILTDLEPEQLKVMLQSAGFIKIGGGALVGVAAFFGTLRAVFTFFSTVPIGGVWIGTSALVCVLSVMSGFENDLRKKILGSNAHIQITREDGDFVEWRDVKARVDRLPGVVASTPYAVSEVVIAASSNGMNVIIKGIDPKTVGKVTELVGDLEDPEAMKRLLPLTDEDGEPGAPGDVPRPGVPAPPAKAAKPPGGGVVDPAPPDMIEPAEPIDLSGTVDAGAAAAARHPGGSIGDTEAPATLPAFGGGSADPDAPTRTIDLQPRRGKVIDPAPTDLLSSDDPPLDYSRPGAIDEAIVASDDLGDGPAISRRTRSLHGVLVGRELVKQTHMWTGQEVRVVSPLSDPSNPDANGTPIPFNRDYRIAGIFYTGMYEYDLKYVYVSLESLQDFLDRGDVVDGIEVRVTSADETDRYVADISKALGPAYRVVDWKELNRSLFSALKLEKVAMFLVLGIVILVASFSIVGNLIMVVVEKGREIALLKTLGASSASVMMIFVMQGLLIGLVGTGLGVGMGRAACWYADVHGLPLNPDVYYINRLPINVDNASMLLVTLAGVLISVVATLYPGFLATRIRPAAGMRV
jgi:lipoprotein-releasing system permease protein